MTTEDIAGKLAFFHEQFHMIHWETRTFAEHKSTGDFYEYLQEFKDEVVEKLMGYTGKRIKGLKIESIKPGMDAMDLADQVMKFATELEAYGESNKYGDICNIAQALSGETAKLKYLLTLS